MLLLDLGVGQLALHRDPGACDARLGAHHRQLVIGVVDLDQRLARAELGAFDADGYLTITGRAGEIINRGGQKIAPAEVEAAVAAGAGAKEGPSDAEASPEALAAATEILEQLVEMMGYDASVDYVTETMEAAGYEVVDTAAEGVEAVRSGIWPESAELDATALDQLLTRVHASLQPPTRFPVVFTLPFSIVRGVRI